MRSCIGDTQFSTGWFCLHIVGPSYSFTITGSPFPSFIWKTIVLTHHSPCGSVVSNPDQIGYWNQWFSLLDCHYQMWSFDVLTVEQPPVPQFCYHPPRHTWCDHPSCLPCTQGMCLFGALVCMSLGTTSPNHACILLSSVGMNFSSSFCLSKDSASCSAAVFFDCNCFQVNIYPMQQKLGVQDTCQGDSLHGPYQLSFEISNTLDHL